jgi:hypothetical protein
MNATTAENMSGKIATPQDLADRLKATLAAVHTREK